ncbi:MAG: FAD-dependent oxidoreductase [Bryobacteraceae bacterium]
MLVTSSWNRRRIVRALAGAAALPVVSRGAMRRVGIVGSGMAGVSLAWLLDGRREVVLLEARDTIGGNVQTIPVNVDGQTVVVDMGAQYFHPGPYPTYVRLLRKLGLLRDTHSFAASITLEAPGAATPLFVSPVLPGRAWPLLAEWNRAGLQAFAVAFSEAKAREEASASYSLTLGDWLPTLGLTREQWEGMILPWAASLYSGNIEQARGLSARAAMVFAAKALPEKATDPLLYYALKRGMVEPLRRMLAQCHTVRVLTGAEVKTVGRDAQGGFLVGYGAGGQTQVDDLVFASSGPATLQLLAGMPETSAQQTALRGIEFHDTRLALHMDPVYAAAKENYRSFFNAQIHGGYCQASMWLKEVVGANVWKSWVTHRTSQPGQILHQAAFRHMLPTAASIQAQNEVRPLQGRDGIWLTGGYLHPFDSQETALLSAMDVAEGLAGTGARMAELESA